MLKSIRYMNPGGNITAIVTEAYPVSQRIILSKEIIASGKAEQVGFEVPPLMGSLGRLEMMGGEFCGNATRAFAYMKVSVVECTGRHQVTIEISGAEAPVVVDVDLDHKEAYTHMPVPLGSRMIQIGGKSYVRVHMDGIDHVMVTDQDPDPSLVQEMLESMKADMPDACGMMFLKKTAVDHVYQLTPAVYVKATDSLVWESSCGSGSVAAAWYFSMLEDPQEKQLSLCFKEPGGEIKVDIERTDERITACIMGGPITEI